ncbi:MAG: metallophosphoesterase [Verrucomicrobiota bacterium]
MAQIRATFLATGLCILVNQLCVAHLNHESASTLVDASTKHETHDIRIEVMDGPNPWTERPFVNNPRDFQFAVISDNTGGMRPGVIETAVEKLNLLQPEFVMSVGDLIEGYTEDIDRLVFEWDEFDAKIEPLEMRFFYIPGNHDMTNEVMAKLWEERLGRSYYHFVYNDVLFLCLNTEDTKKETISPTQIKWVTETLADHTDVRWTMVFMHKPLWQYEMDYAARKNSNESSGWLEVEAILKDRKHTVLCGHYHSYSHYEINDSDYIILGTTGGGSQLRGPEYGEIDHISWITMTDEGPTIANIAIEGILPKDFSKPESTRFLYETLRLIKVAVAPVYSNKGILPAVYDAEVFLENEGIHDVTLSFELPQLNGLKLALEKSVWDLPAKSSTTIPLQLTSLNGSDSVLPTAIEIPYAVTASLANDVNVEFVENLSFVASPIYPTEGEAIDWIMVKAPTEVGGNAEVWTGAEDGSFKFKVEQIDGSLIVDVLVFDDALVRPSEVEAAWIGDGLELRVSPILDPLRSIETTRFWQDQNKSYFAMYLVPDVPVRSYSYNYGTKIPKGITASCTSETDEGTYRAKVEIPVSVINGFAEGEANKVRLSIGLNDRDAPGEQPAQIWWPEDWRSNEMTVGSGTFEL